MPAPAVVIRGMRKRYGDFEALRGVDLEVQRGEVFSLLGPNGAGKTTLVEILEGYRERSAGEAVVLGIDPANGGRDWRARIGVVLQNTTVFDALTVREAVSHFASFYADPLPTERVIGLVGLADKATARCKSLSGGQKRRVDLALGLVGDPELIFLDEPTTGLDPQGRRQLWDVVREFTALGKTVMLTTHYLDEAEALSDRVGVIIAGEMAALGTPAELGGRQHAVATIRFERAGALASAELPRLDGEIELNGTDVRVKTGSPTRAVRELGAWASALGFAELPGLSVVRPSLEDTYLAMVENAEKE